MFRLTTWNMNRRNGLAPWTALSLLTNPGVACVQEAIVPAGVHHAPYSTTGTKRQRGAAVVSFGLELSPGRDVDLEPGRGSLAIVEENKRQIHVASLHVPKGKVPGLGGNQIEAYVLLYWLDGPLRSFLEAGKRGVDTIIAGDLNTSTQWAKSVHARVQGRLLDAGFVDAIAVTADTRPPLQGCRCEDQVCRHAATYGRAWSIDYIWLSSSLAANLVSCEIHEIPRENDRPLSDHAPVTVDLAI